MKRAFILTIAGIGVSAVAGGGALVAAMQPDQTRSIAAFALTVFLVTLFITFLADHFFGEGRREGQIEAEDYFTGTRRTS